MQHLEPFKRLASQYETLRGASAQALEEGEGGEVLGNEYSLQQLWHHQAFENRVLHLTDGSALEVVEPGRWNHAEGPDFKDAILIIAGELRRGDIELHVRPSDWDAHGHATDPAYGNLILHVTWYEKPLAKTLFPQVPSLSLAQNFPEYEVFTELHRGLSADANGMTHPCLAYFQKDAIAFDRLLCSAGYYRLMAKTNRFIESLQAEDATQVFYENLMATMGYSRNAEPFRRLAKEYPLSLLAPFSTKRRFAILARVAGLLSENHRELWDLWWNSGIRPPMEPFIWNFKGLRPQNHPFRRLAGALGILQHLSKLLELPFTELPTAILAASEVLRAEIGSKTALVGLKRATVVMINLFVPYRLALGALSERQLQALPGEDISMPMRETWLRLTGKRTGVPKDGLRQQGLLQIYADFCHNPRIVCATCPLLKKM
jgi:hypothetical protein